MPQHHNLPLAALPPDDFEAIAVHLQLITTKQGEILAEVGRPVDRLYFPHSGIISYVVDLQDGGMIATGMIGKDGVMGVGPALGDKHSLNKVIVQIPGPASVLDARQALQLANQSEIFRTLLVRH